MKIFICSLFIALLLLSSPAKSQEVEDEHEFNYDEKSDRGPSHWGDIKPEWSLCKNGRMQSPIDLDNEKVVENLLGPLILNYNPSNATLKNRGHDISLEEDLKAISNSTSISVGVIDPREVNINKNMYYRFMGSLTTPPCSENVTWTIVKQIGSVTRDQINLLRDAVHDDSNGNARPIQPTNNRTVQLNIPKYISIFN
ncbi:hypothetical protein PIB30_036406 [Stylosanthes scabra]|uniref:Alpha-carbonic anhydrase domain-containing protein n=1 Tax=Stylosanthes scabra TaxID=79078 RepID=A0ABU6RDG1_9FABA|nr:hypothetical protein [Stylosanthes scabra]